MSTKKKEGPPAFSLFGKVRGAVLALLHGRPDESFYVREIVRWVDAGQGAVQRELGALAAAGILERSARGKQVYFQANRKCPFFPELHGLMIKTEGLSGIIAESLGPLGGSVEIAFIYGSQARGSATASSDVDLFLVADADEVRLHREIAAAERKLGRSVNYTLMDRAEFQRRRSEKGGFVERALSGPRIPIKGDVDEI